MRVTLVAVAASVCCMFVTIMLLVVGTTFGVVLATREPSTVVRQSASSSCASGVPIDPLSGAEPETGPSCVSNDRWFDGYTSLFLEAPEGCAAYDAQPERCTAGVLYGIDNRSLFDASLIGTGASTACCACGGGTDDSLRSSTVPREQGVVLHVQRGSVDDCIVAFEDVWDEGVAAWRGLGKFDANDWEVDESAADLFYAQCGTLSVLGARDGGCFGSPLNQTLVDQLVTDRVLRIGTNASEGLARSVKWVVGDCLSRRVRLLPTIDRLAVTATTAFFRFENTHSFWETVAIPTPDAREMIAIVTPRDTVPQTRAVVQDTVTGRVQARLGFGAYPSWPSAALTPLNCAEDWSCHLSYDDWCREMMLEERDCSRPSESGENPLGALRRCEPGGTSPRFCIERGRFLTLLDAWGDGWGRGALVCTDGVSSGEVRLTVNNATTNSTFDAMCQRR